MAVVYFDSSALVKLVIEEPGSDLAADLWNGCDAAFTSRLAHAEVRAALGATRRNSDLSEAEFAVAEDEWSLFRVGLRPVEMTADVEQSAGELAVQLALRGADAVHLASALVIGAPGMVVATWDKRLHAGVAAVGLAVAPLVL